MVAAREDYPDFETALQAASSRFGATHVVRHGRSATIFSPTSRGYERRTMSADRGFFHWPRQADMVDDVPTGAEMLVDVLDVGFDPDVAPRPEAMPVSGRRAAEGVPMGAVREAREGRHYKSAEWLEFECEPATPTPELEAMAAEFKKLLLEFLGSYARTWSIDTSSLDEDSFVWNAYASLVGHGVGLWEGDGDTGLRGDDEKKIDKALRGRWSASGSLVGRLHELAHRISDECSFLSEGAGGREASEASIPTKAQLKIIEAFRQRRLMGNPMRDSISTDGDTIYSYRMPIAGRNPRGGIWIVDPAGAPSVTTRNHIYGLQRTFTPAEIMGTQAAEHDDDRGPDTERMPAPALPPRLQPGYAFYTPSKRKGDWKKIPNDDWEQSVIGEDEIEKSEFVGYRLIDGSMHDIFEVVWDYKSPGGGNYGRGYYAQLQTHTQGRGAAHEFPGGSATAWASDFPSPKDAIAHAQSAWGATHVDFHGTRNRPTVYGMKAGARWKKTLYKEKGKFHWPDKFSKGPKRLHGAIEISGVSKPFVPIRGDKGERLQTPFVPAPPTAPPPDRHEGYVSEEARRGSPRYMSTQNSADALRDNISFDGRFIGSVRGPFRSSAGDFYEWSTSGRSGRASSRRGAFNDLVRAHQARTGAREASEGAREKYQMVVYDADGRVHQSSSSMDLASANRMAERKREEIQRRGWNMTVSVLPVGRRESARENPATDLQDAIPWVRVTRDPERYKEALARAQKIGPVDDARKVYELVGPALMKEDQETFIVVLIDVRQNCRGVAEIHRGARSRVATSVLDVMRVVVASGAEGFIVCHNHPSGKAMPSDADRSLTKAIERAAKPFAGETAFLDHVVIGAGEYYSFADSKLHHAKN